MRSALARMVPGKKQKWLCLADRRFPNLRTIEDVNRSYVRSEMKGSPKRGFGAREKCALLPGTRVHESSSLSPRFIEFRAEGNHAKEPERNSESARQVRSRPNGPTELRSVARSSRRIDLRRECRHAVASRSHQGIRRHRRSRGAGLGIGEEGGGEGDQEDAHHPHSDRLDRQYDALPPQGGG